MDRVIVSKVQSIDRCLRQVRRYYTEHKETFREDFLVQDAIILNLQRACGLCIDLANHILKKEGWGVPRKASENFILLHQNGCIDKELSKKLTSLVGFRNIAVHEYSTLEFDIVVRIIENHLTDIELFAQAILKRYQYEP